MKITVYIISPNKRKIRFDSASLFDDYVRHVRLPKGTNIIIMKGDKVIGEMLVKDYIALAKKELNLLQDENVS